MIVTIYRSFSNASVTTILPLLPPKVNVGCWTRELKVGFQGALVFNTDQGASITRTGIRAQPQALGIQTLIHLP